MLCGGLFLLFKATMELHERLEGVEHSEGNGQKAYAAFATVVVQILVLDAVFSIDSVVTAIGMAEHLEHHDAGRGDCHEHDDHGQQAAHPFRQCSPHRGDAVPGLLLMIGSA
jgi:hypothetical protein